MYLFNQLVQTVQMVGWVWNRILMVMRAKWGKGVRGPKPMKSLRLG